MRRINAAFIAPIIIAFAASAFVYNELPDNFASHWNARGEVNGYMPKLLGALFMPITMAGLALLFVIIPRIDPKKANILKFRKYYDLFIVVMLLFLLLIHVQSLLWNVGIRISMLATLPIGIGILFIAAGILIGKAKMNWFIGIRTPWTLSSEKVWNKTHKIGSKLFIASGIIALFGAIMPDYSIILMITPILFSTFFCTIYSYAEYRKLNKRKPLRMNVW